MNANLMLGCKLFKEKENGDFEIIRIIKVYNQEKVKIRYENDGREEKVLLKDLSEWTILGSIGIVSFSIVELGKNKVENDVIVTLSRNLDIKSGLSVPCVICRQSVTDFFYNLLSNQVDHGFVGVSVSDRTCPPNIEYGHLLACDNISYSNMINIYYDDTIESVLRCVNVIKFNDVLRKLYERHVKAVNNPLLKFRKQDKGWCSDIVTLLEINNFWIDVDQAFNIIDVDFEISNYIIEKKDGKGLDYYSLSKEVLSFFSSTFKINIVDCIILEYGYDIDLFEYRNENYILVRDCDGKLYLMVYLISGEYLESDLAIEEENKHIAYTFGLKIVNKYKGSDTKSNH